MSGNRDRTHLEKLSALQFVKLLYSHGLRLRVDSAFQQADGMAAVLSFVRELCRRRPRAGPYLWSAYDCQRARPWRCLRPEATG